MALFVCCCCCCFCFLLTQSCHHQIEENSLNKSHKRDGTKFSYSFWIGWDIDLLMHKKHILRAIGQNEEILMMECLVLLNLVSNIIVRPKSPVSRLVFTRADQWKHQSSASLTFVRGNVNSPHKGPVTRKMLPFDDVIMLLFHYRGCSERNRYDSTPLWLRLWDIID